MSDTPREPLSAEELANDFYRRLQPLEQDNLRLRRLMNMTLIGAGVTLGLVTALVVVAARYGLPGSVAPVVEARSFVIRDRTGRVRGSWGIDDSGALRLVMVDRGGQPAMTIAVLQDGAPGIQLADSAGRARIVLGLLHDHTASLAIADQAGVARATLGVSSVGASTITFADRGGFSRAGLGVDERGGGTFTMPEQGRNIGPSGTSDSTTPASPR